MVGKWTGLVKIAHITSLFFAVGTPSRVIVLDDNRTPHHLSAVEKGDPILALLTAGRLAFCAAR
jgi:hypothetical protein